MGPDATEPRHTRELPPPEALRLLAGVPFGRIAFTLDGTPTIRVVNHVVDDGRIVFRTHPAGGIAAGLTPFENAVVAFEADRIDAETRSGWTVVATGPARPVTDVDLLVEYTRLLAPWAAGPRHAVIAVEPHTVSGIRLA
ncbi:MAG TPA: pyridoxamine 5'-phosphate oxidase family protein [Phytomonospora sp.]